MVMMAVVQLSSSSSVPFPPLPCTHTPSLSYGRGDWLSDQMVEYRVEVLRF